MIKLLLFCLSILIGSESDLLIDDIIKKIDFNLNSENRFIESRMIVNGRRNSRTIISKSWIIGVDKAFTEYISPAREAGTKMLKVDDKLYTYSPQTDRVIQISGHMLRQSVMGSDMSYNDILEDKPLHDIYDAILEREELVDGRNCYVIYLTASVSGLAYPQRRSWVDVEYFLPIREELYAKSGKLLKSTSVDGIKQIGNRWFPTTFIFKDELKRGSKGTEWIIEDIAFDIDMPVSLFLKSNLRK